MDNILRIDSFIILSIPIAFHPSFCDIVASYFSIRVLNTIYDLDACTVRSFYVFCRYAHRVNHLKSVAESVINPEPFSQENLSVSDCCGDNNTLKINTRPVASLRANTFLTPLLPSEFYFRVCLLVLISFRVLYFCLKLDATRPDDVIHIHLDEPRVVPVIISEPARPAPQRAKIPPKGFITRKIYARPVSV